MLRRIERTTRPADVADATLDATFDSGPDAADAGSDAPVVVDGSAEADAVADASVPIRARRAHRIGCAPDDACGRG